MATAKLSEMLEDLRAETGASVQPGHNLAQDDTQRYLLRRVQRVLYLEHDWPDLEIEEDVVVPAGTSYLPALAELNFEQINRMWCAYGSDWRRLELGIDPEHYAAYPPGTQGFPIRRYRYDAGQPGIELWPVPAQDVTVKVRGQKPLAPLKLDDDVSTLDATLIVMFAAAEMSARLKHEDAGLKLSLAQNYLRTLKKNLSSDKSPVTPLTPTPARRLRPYLDYMP